MARSTTRLSTLCHKLLPVAILSALLIASVSQQTIAQNAEASASASTSSSGGSGGSSSGGGILGAATGAIAGGIEGAKAGAKAGSEAGSSGSAQMSGSIGGVSGSLSIGGGGASASGSTSGSSGSSDSSSSSSGSASASGSISGSSSGSASGSASASGSTSSSGSSSGSGSSSASASASISFTSTPKPEGLFSKIKEVVKSSVDSLTHDDKKDNSMAQSGTAAQASGSLGSGSESGASAHVSANVNSNSVSGSGSSGSSGSSGGLISKLKEGAKEMKEEVKSAFSSSGEQSDKGSSMSGGVKIGTANSNVQIGGSVQMGNGGEKKEGTLSKLVHKVENKASEIGDKIKKPFREESQSNFHASASFQAQGQGQGQSQAQAQAQVGTEDSLAVQVLDKSHQAVKEPLAKALRPIDKALGVKQDPLLRMYDAGHEKLRQPLAMVSKPVESVFSGAFKTSDEARRDAERSGNEMDRREVRIRDEKLKKQGRSILGEITDRSVELAEKPFEIILRPVDRLLGLDKEGKKNPLIQLIDEIYGISKKPIDAVAKPFENILKKMAGGDYQVSVRFNTEANDPKLFTRLADGALNIADRIVTRPIEFAMRPLGYGQDRNNPIVDATHSLKNATKLGVELFTRPIDRIIKEIADIGAIKDEQQRETEMQRKRQEASRIVHALDKLHEISQTPWEIVLRPVGKVLGYNKEGRKEPLLRAWDVVHQVIRTPIQVLSKPWEDAILGETQRARQAAQQPKVQAKASVRVGQGSHEKKNFFTEQIRKVEKLATKPFDVITSPIRRLILGEDGKSGARFNAKAQVGGVQAKVSAGASSNQGPDKIVKTIEQMNNVVLKPLEMITQPISDMLSSEGKQQQSKGVNAQVSASSSSSGSSGQQARASGSISAGGGGGISASGSASVKSG